MAWSTPLTAVSNTALTAAQWNASVRDNLLATAPAIVTGAGQVPVSTGANALAARVPQSSKLSTLDTTASTTYTSSLASTSGPAVSGVITGISALVFSRSDAVNSGANASVASFAVSGATTLAAADSNAVGPDGTGKVRAGACVLLFAGLTAGNNTFTMNYRVTGGTGTFANREIGVFPL